MNKLSQELFSLIGGKNKLTALGHRKDSLFFDLESVPEVEKLEKLPHVKSATVEKNHVSLKTNKEATALYYELLDDPDETQSKPNLFNRLLDTLSGIFMPILGFLAATGMLKGLMSALSALKLMDSHSGTYQVLYAISDGFFYFLPIVLGYSASKRFKTSPLIGITIGATLTYPSIVQMASPESATPLFTLFANTPLQTHVFDTFFGIPLIMVNYTSSVIPVIVGVLLASKLEKFFTKWIPEIIQNFIVPFCTLIITIPLIFLIIGPLTTWLSQGMGWIIQTLVQLNPAIAGLVLGVLWQPLVVLGLHWGIIPIAFINIATVGQDPIMALTFAALYAQIGAVLGVMLKTKDKKFKALSLSAFITGVFGISEPSMFGVTIPTKKPFVISMIGAGIGGLIMGLFNTLVYTVGVLGFFTFLTYIPNDGNLTGLFAAIAACAVAFIFSFIVSYIVYTDKDKPTV
ncbi:PTS transporter subunit EIIC [Holzapfeliella floricola]|uniref:PTS family porter enzyme II n=2 Tax=Holzapfeliella TaxID=2767883 RepID=A0A0R2DLW8_9LACO|nr:PTS transporter subunit EIIC [Holzapfeliella floricola]KRN04662.1 PTS family porter enzyme II [Holzapfeliella floricola DSM 23037 = JCM 16512]